MSGDEDDDSWQRTHGMHFPFDPFQGIALFAYCLFMMTMFTFHLPLYWGYDPVLDVFLIIFAVWAPLNVVTYVLAALAPVHDPGLDKKCEEWELPYAPPGYTACYTCKAHVDARAKHCWKCNKCVVGFDHHCNWLNHCVGERNYSIFAVFLGNTTALMACQIGLSMWVLHHANGSQDEFERLCQQTYSSDFKPRQLFGFLVFACVLECIAWLPLAQLSWLHLYLKYRGISTYQNILENRQKKRDERSERERLGMQGTEPLCHSFAVWQFKREKARKENEKPPVGASPTYKSTIALDHSFSTRPEGGGGGGTTAGQQEGSLMTTNDTEDVNGTMSRQTPTQLDDTGAEGDNFNAEQQHDDKAYSDVKDHPDDEIRIDLAGAPPPIYEYDEYHEPAEPPSAGPASYPDDNGMEIGLPVQSPASGGQGRGFNSSQITLRTMPNLESPSLLDDTHSPAFDTSEANTRQVQVLSAAGRLTGEQSPGEAPNPSLPGLRQSSEMPFGANHQTQVFEQRQATTSPDYRDPNFIQESTS